MSVRGFLLGGVWRPVEAPRAFPTAKICVVVGMRQLLVRVDSDRSQVNPARTPSIATEAAFDVLVLLGAPKTGPRARFRSGEVWISRRS
jgi:hypothetical protein